MVVARTPDDGAGSDRVQEVGVDIERANSARMYDWFLGGAHNFEVDRVRAGSALAANPDAVALAWANRSFLARVVEQCLDFGISQFLDLGSGIPTVGNVHEIAHRRDLAARVAYVDVEPVATAHAAAILGDLGTVTVTRADLCDPDKVLAAPGVAGLLDFTRPVALLAVSVLHFVDPSRDLAVIMSQYVRSLAAGSAVAISHVSEDQDDPELAERIRRELAEYRTSATPAWSRSRDELHALFDGLTGFTMAPPGLVDVIEWPTPGARDPAGRGRYAAAAYRDRPNEGSSPSP